MVPEEALQQHAQGVMIYRIVEGNRVQRVRVETGVFNDSWVEVRGTIGDGDQVVVRGQSGLVDGGVVSIRTRDGRPVDQPQVASPAALPEPGADG